MILLQKVTELLTDAGYMVNNIDVTVVAQQPKLAGYIPQMEANLSQVLQVPIDVVNVKATTTEKLGFEGEGLGISAYAVCSIKRTQV